MSCSTVPYKTPLIPHLQRYIDIVENDEFPVSEEWQKPLVRYVRHVFETEELTVDCIRVERYLSYQKYFPFELFPWEVFVFILHTCVFKKNGAPRWKDLLALMGRGAGKNGFLAFECFCLSTDTNGIAYYDIDICANSEDQAKTSFMDIHNILEDPKLRPKLEKHFRWNLTEIVNQKTRSRIKYRTNNPKGKDGLRSAMVAFDEIHAYENWDNIDVFTTGLGKKPHPRRIYITTNGDVRDGPLDQLIKKSRQILNGEIPDNGFLPFICQLDADEEVHDPSLWTKANPSLPYLPTLMEEMLGEYEDYKLDPINNSGFMTKRMNRPQGRRDTEVTSWENILATNREVPDLTGWSCVCGIDFQKTTDFASAFLLFKEREQWYGIHHSWFCTASADRHRIKLPLEDQVQRGLLTIVDDVEISQDIIVGWIKAQKARYNIKKIALDSYRYSVLAQALKKEGFDAKDGKVKLLRPSDIMQVVQKISSGFIGHRIIWGDDPMMRWYTNNTKQVPAKNNNFTYEKIEPRSRKTDGFMAFVAAMTIEEELPESYNLEWLPPIIL
jgi:phage terminase large subunit-like protein